MSTPSVARAAPAGRPRNPEIDLACLDAARQLYGERGSAAVSIEAVSRRSGVGKPAIYRRWPSSDSLLVDALASFDFDVSVPDVNDIRAELIAFAQALMNCYLSPDGAVLLRLMTEIHQRSDLYLAVGNIAVEKTFHSVTNIVRRGISRQEVDPALSSTLVAGVMAGSVLFEALARRSGAALSIPGPEFFTMLVDSVLALPHGAAPSPPVVQ